MTQKEKKLLFADMCARIPYDTIVLHNAPIGEHEIVVADAIDMACDIELCRLYLRSLTTMTREEGEEMRKLMPYYATIYVKGGELEVYIDTDEYDSTIWAGSIFDVADWLNEHHFDYRGLIEKGLAIEAPDGMYN